MPLPVPAAAPPLPSPFRIDTRFAPDETQEKYANVAVSGGAGIGASDDQLRSRVQSGFLDQPGPNVFRLPGSAESPIARLRSLIIDIGGDVVASRYTAAALLGFDSYILKPPFDLSVGRDRHVVRIGHRIHQVADLDLIDRGNEQNVPVTRRARTLIGFRPYQFTYEMLVDHPASVIEEVRHALELD